MFPKRQTWWLKGLFLGLIAIGALGFVVRGKMRTFGSLPLGEKKYDVVLAQSPDEIVRGLSYRKDIGADGMLFLLPTRSMPSFWMLEMRFPLDMIWIDDTTVVSLSENVPIPLPGSPQSDIARVAPTQPVTAVLEVPAGFIQRESVKIGTQVGQVTELRTKMW